MRKGLLAAAGAVVAAAVVLAVVLTQTGNDAPIVADPAVPIAAMTSSVPDRQTTEVPTSTEPPVSAEVPTIPPTQGSQQTETQSPTPSSSAKTASISKPAPAPRTSFTGSDGTVFAVSFKARDHISNCAANSTKQVAQFFQSYGCDGATRLLARVNLGGRPAGLSVMLVKFEDSSSADSFYQVENAPGTGTLADLLMAGTSVPGFPSDIPSPEVFHPYPVGTSVWIVDAWWLDGPTDRDDPQLNHLANTTVGSDIFDQ